MPIHSDIDVRMKTYYEQIPKTKLMRRVPVAIRIDGKAFHTFTRGFQKPFDEVLIEAMQNTMEYLCKNIQGCVFGYTQSDEITLILIDYQKLNSSAWFDYEVQKLCSISASMATMAFNREFEGAYARWRANLLNTTDTQKTINLRDSYLTALGKGAMFDARCFNIPKEEVCNLIFSRQVDATRNSIQMVAQANFSHKQLQGLSCNKLQDKLLTEKDINWNDFPTHQKRGTACYKEVIRLTHWEKAGDLMGEVIDKIYDEWKLDTEMPILKGKDREYVDKHIYVGEY